MRETWVRSLGWEDPLRRAWQPTPVFLPAESPWTGDLLDPGIEPASLASPALAGGSFTTALDSPING